MVDESVGNRSEQQTIQDPVTTGTHHEQVGIDARGSECRTRVAGDDAQALDAALAPFLEDGRYRWARSEPTLEDVFISLMGRSKDNFQ